MNCRVSIIGVAIILPFFRKYNLNQYILTRHYVYSFRVSGKFLTVKIIPFVNVAEILAVG